MSKLLLLDHALLNTDAGQAAVIAAYVQGYSPRDVGIRCFGDFSGLITWRAVVSFVQRWAQTRWEPDMRPATYAHNVAAYALEQYRASLPEHANHPGDDRRGRGGAVTPSPERGTGRGDLSRNVGSQ